MPDFLSTALLLVAAYFVGSIPVAFILVKVARGGDLRDLGSSNIGAMNTYEVTHSRLLGISVGLLDALKGFAGVLLLPIFIDGGPSAQPQILRSVALLGIVAGHNYNLWLSIGSGRLEGGKGLAAAGGGLLVFMAWLIPGWGLLYAVGLLLCEQWRGERKIIVGNVFALLTLPLPGYFLYGSEGLWTCLLVAGLILPKHVQQVYDILTRSTR